MIIFLLCRFYRVFDIALGLQLRSAVFRWRMAVSAMKRRELLVFDLRERHTARFKGGFFDRWSRLWRVRRHRRKALHR